jgi:hypothetical protein
VRGGDSLAASMEKRDEHNIRYEGAVSDVSSTKELVSA